MGSSVGIRAGGLPASLPEGEERVSAEQVREVERTAHTHLKTTLSSSGSQVPRKLIVNTFSFLHEINMQTEGPLYRHGVN